MVYMLNSLHHRSFTYIGKTTNARIRLYNHNSRHGSSTTEPYHLCPYAIMAYISGFDGNAELMLVIDRKWKILRDNLIREGENDPQVWAA